ncbi:MAG TPA: outer membrane beta-barrel protein [Rhodothermales bacterium]|nr:outer membrane beta-barrel protein [Rhodothermales bacterium]
MRTPLLTAALALAALAAPAAHAQLLPSFGVAGGVNFASLNDVTGADLDNATGYHIGLYADLGFGPLAVRPGIYYLRAGDVETVGGAELVSADFITIPIDVRFQTPLPVLKAYALAGPEFRFPVGDGGALVDTRAVNVAANVGVGASFNPPLAGPSGFLELRYAFDVTGFAEATGATSGDSDYRVSLFMVRAGIGL